eukprot:5959768-Alexandrium_andersonii.AAC.1
MLAHVPEEDFKHATSDLGLLSRPLRRARRVHPDRSRGQGPPLGVPSAGPLGLQEVPGHSRRRPAGRGQ